MKYYEVDFKLKVVKEYLEGPLGGRALAKKYGLPSNALIYNWIQTYQLFGEKGLETHRTPTKYTRDFKRDVVHFIETTEASYSETARQFNLPSGSMISRWHKRYLTSEKTALSNRKGRSTIMKKKPSKKQKRKQTDREKELALEVERLNIEVEYLKKLRTFQQTIMAKRNEESKPE